MHKPIIIKSGQDLPRKKKKVFRKAVQKFKEHWEKCYNQNSIPFVTVSTDKIEFIKLG